MSTTNAGESSKGEGILGDDSFLEIKHQELSSQTIKMRENSFITKRRSTYHNRFSTIIKMILNYKKSSNPSSS